MNHWKIAPALAAAGVALATLSAPAVASAETASAKTASVETVTAKAKHKKSAKCKTPRGKKINISWGDGNVTTTVYYNNHCKQTRGIKLQFVKQNGEIKNVCKNAKARKKDKLKYDNGMPNKVTILAGKCP
ncbi:hypothetical protein GCM10009678_72870 [Actinomadura kijaniata]|uniref:Uncharacterized protein n=1 Tax=Actinomadura namibiensis TaxID=182080 RepID=A0A7W3QS72_ACTNM|nr:hypothetical protein [Actinomadura namibiensis]MBA8957539.1 hypothetical protein [Actinomadura namibiensis]